CIHTQHLFIFICIISLYFQSYPRHLLSFPTRRSSDLTPTTSWSTATRLVVDQSVFTTRTSRNVFSTSWAFPMKRPKRSSVSCWIDRKSTRLNSSHVSISYAVFCLKKKISIYTSVGLIE